MPCPIAMLSFCLLLFGISFASALTLQSSSGLSNEALPSLINITNSSIPVASRGIEFECFDDIIQDPDLARSCLDALHHMKFVPGSTIQQYTWGPRDTGTRYDVYAPQLVVSSDGKCIIYVYLPGPEHNPARASQLQVENGVAMIMNHCLAQTPPAMGFASKFNEVGNLNVAVTQPIDPIEPPNMVCYGAMPSSGEASCRDLFNHLSTKSDDILFGPSSDPNAKIHTPLNIVSQDRRCALTVTTPESSVNLSWSRIWHTGIELTGICTRRGMQGRYSNVGQHPRVIMQLTSSPADVSSS